MENNLIIICPVCGFSFKPEYSHSHIRKRIIKCPMCGYKFSESDIFPQKRENFGKKFI